MISLTGSYVKLGKSDGCSADGLGASGVRAGLTAAPLLPADWWFGARGYGGKVVHFSLSRSLSAISEPTVGLFSDELPDGRCWHWQRMLKSPGVLSFTQRFKL